MNQRTEPTKAENEAAVAELKREELPKFYTNARAGLAPHNLMAYCVIASESDGRQYHVADFYWREHKNPNNTTFHREQARIMANQLAERINNA